MKILLMIKIRVKLSDTQQFLLLLFKFSFHQPEINDKFVEKSQKVFLCVFLNNQICTSEKVEQEAGLFLLSNFREKLFRKKNVEHEMHRCLSLFSRFSLYFISAAALSLAILTLVMSDPAFKLILSSCKFWLSNSPCMSLAMFRKLPIMELT